MLVSGFTILRNGMKFDFPFAESIQSALPVCDEFIINLGDSEDSTRQAIEQLRLRLPPAEAQKIQFFETKWPLDQKEKRRNGQILADQTNLALERCRGKWCLYLQADEVLHENDLAGLRSECMQHADHPEVEGFVFQYLHFYGSYDVIQTSRSAYRREIRMIRNGLGIRSTGDAQSFRHADGRKVAAVLTKTRVFHYGWARPQEIMKQKTAFMDSLYHSTASAADAAPATGDAYLYKRIVGLRKFQQTHPKVMALRIQGAPRFDFDRAPKVFAMKDLWKVASGLIERATGYRPFEFRNYRLLKR